MRLFSLLTLILLALEPQSVHGQSPDDSPGNGQDRVLSLDEYVSAYASANLFSGVVLVADNGKILLRKGYGLADREHNIANTPTGRFDIGSVAKTFTSTTVLMLVDQRRLSLEDPICRYLDGCPPQWQPVTIRHLLTHTSGIRNYTELPDFYELRALASYLAKALAEIRALPLDFPPGQRFAYSNTGYLLLHRVVEKASGESYEHFLRTSILTPLGLNGTGFLVQPGIRHVIVQGRAVGYTDGRGPLENAPWVYPNSGGGLYSTVDDLYRFDQALRSGKLLSAAMTEAALTPVKNNYGLGWFIFKGPAGRLAMHGGGIPGYASNFSRLLEEGLTIILLSNLDTAPLDRMANDLRTIVAGKPVSRPKAYVEIEVGEPALKEYVGRYRDMTGQRPQVWTLSIQDGRLWIRQGDDPGETETVLRAFGPDRFFNRTFSIYELAFSRDATGRITGFVAPGPWGKGEFARIE